MKLFFSAGLVFTALCLAGCAQPPSKEGLLSREARCLRCYCASNAVVAEVALLECARYANQCQEAGVEGIQYDEVFARCYGRLYVVERRLGHTQAAEQCLEKYAHFHALLSSLARQAGRPHGEMVRLIEDKYDLGLQTAWRTH